VTIISAPFRQNNCLIIQDYKLDKTGRIYLNNHVSNNIDLNKYIQKQALSCINYNRSYQFDVEDQSEFLHPIFPYIQMMSSTTDISNFIEQSQYIIHAYLSIGACQRFYKIRPYIRPNFSDPSKLFVSNINNKVKANQYLSSKMVIFHCYLDSKKSPCIGIFKLKQNYKKWEIDNKQSCLILTGSNFSIYLGEINNNLWVNNFLKLKIT
jgi:hypothetical protein